MKYIIYTMMVCLFFVSAAYSQFDLLKKAKQKIEQKVEEKVDEELNKDKKKEQKPAEEKKEEVAVADKKNENTGTTPASTESSELKTYSKFDFVPGEKIIFFDDFSLDNPGDFPQKWNTNGTGEVVTLNKYPGKWFKLKNSTTYLPYYSTNTFGENFTIEFDLLVDVDQKTNPGALYIDLFHTENLDKVPQASSGPYTAGSFVSMHFSNSGTSNYNIHNTKTENKSVVDGGIRNGLSDDAFKIGTINRVSISVNKNRYRLYVNDKKIYDLPRLMFPEENYNSIAFRTWSWNEAKDYQLLVGNFRIAEGQSATQNKLITEGRFVTRGILFDSGSDKIKPESYGTLKKITPYEFFGFPLSKIIILAIIGVILILIIPLNFLPFLKKGEKLKAVPWLYFFIIGMGFMFVEVILIQKYSLFIGTSIYSIAAVLLSLLVGSAAGSFYSKRFNDKIAFRGIMLMLLLNITLFPLLLSSLSSLDILFRVIIAVILNLPLGFFMGMPFPKGALRVGELIDWCFAINGAASVLGSVLIIYIAFSFGFIVSIVAAMILYAVACNLLKKMENVV